MKQIHAWFRSNTFLLLGLLSVLSFSHIGQGTLSVDAIRYAGIAKHMLVEQSWLAPVDPTSGQLYANKPPLLIWCTAIVFKLFGFSTLLAKTCSVSFAILALVLLYRGLSRCLQKKGTALLAVLLLFCNRTFMRDVFDLNFEGLALLGLVLCFIQGFTFASLESLDGAQISLRFWFIFALGFLLLLQSKVPYAFLVLFSFGVFLLLSGQLSNVLRSKSFWIALVPALVIEGIWLIYAGSSYILAAADNQFVEPLRSVQSQSERLWEWIEHLLLSWAPLAPIGVFALLKGKRLSMAWPQRQFLYLWAATALAIILIAGNRPRYLLMPMIAVAALAAEYVSLRIEQKFVRSVMVLVIGGFLLVVVVSKLLGIPLHRSSAYVEVIRQDTTLLNGTTVLCADDHDPERSEREASFLRVLLWLEFDRETSVKPSSAVTPEEIAERRILANGLCLERLKTRYRFSEQTRVHRKLTLLSQAPEVS